MADLRQVVRAAYAGLLDRLQLKKQERLAIAALIAAIIIGQAAIFFKYRYNPLWMENLQIKTTADSAKLSTDPKEILTQVEIKLAIPDTTHPDSSQITPPHPTKSSIHTSDAPKNTIQGQRINLNTALTKELEQLPGIGPKMAQRILDYRLENGGFKRAEDLQKIKGIGRKTYDKLKDLIVVE